MLNLSFVSKKYLFDFLLFYVCFGRLCELGDEKYR